MITPRRVLALAICLALSALGLVWFFKDTEWARLGQALYGANYLYVFPAVFFTLLMYVIRAYRWQILMNPIKRIRWIHLLSATVIGFMANCVLPARVGELVRATAIALKEQISPATALTTVIVERIFDLLAVGVFVAIVLVMMPAEGPKPVTRHLHGWSATPSTTDSSMQLPKKFSVGDLRKWGLVVGVVTGAAFVMVFLMKLFPSTTLTISSLPLRILPHALQERGMRILSGLVAGLQALESWTQVIYLAALSVLHWGAQVISNITLGWCFGLHLGFSGGSLVFVITALAVALPQAPGFVGVMDYAGLVAMGLLGVEATIAQSYVIVLHAVAVVPVTLLGFAFLWWEGLSFRQVTKRES